jgi:hypothetical protein
MDLHGNPIVGRDGESLSCHMVCPQGSEAAVHVGCWFPSSGRLILKSHLQIPPLCALSSAPGLRRENERALYCWKRRQITVTLYRYLDVYSYVLQSRRHGWRFLFSFLWYVAVARCGCSCTCYHAVLICSMRDPAWLVKLVVCQYSTAQYRYRVFVGQQAWLGHYRWLPRS